jgi:c-di-GMP-binding flagellar brake protein YcgR
MPLRVRGRIVNHPHEGGELGMGVEFIEVDTATQRALSDFAARTARERGS